jgi:protocatechuate 3,4-dioxygenase beta subunit
MPGFAPLEESSQPPLLYPDYRSTVRRTPKRPLLPLPQTLSELSGPVYGHDDVNEEDADLTRQGEDEPLGQRMVVSGRVLDQSGRAVPDTLVEVWQANACGRYLHSGDRHPAPLDPNFYGAGRCVTDRDGRYRFVTIKPGAYPWQNGGDSWRPAHIHFSLFGPAFATRLVTQMYFPGDPLLSGDPIFNSIRDERARSRLLCDFDPELTVPEWALGFHFDLVLRGREATPIED